MVPTVRTWAGRARSPVSGPACVVHCSFGCLPAERGAPSTRGPSSAACRRVTKGRERTMGRGRDLFRRSAALGAALLIAACTDAPTASPTGTVGPGATNGASTVPTELPSLPPVETLAPSPIPTQASVAGAWNAVLGQKAVTNAQLLDVVWTGTRFIAAGLNLNGGGALVSSTDGQRWRSIAAGGTTGAPEHLAAGPGGVVAVGTID